MPASSSLVDVDPVLVRRVTDYPYWAETCYRIIDKRGQLVPLRLNAAQRMVHDLEIVLMERHGQVRLFVLKGRQGGISTHQQAKNLHLVTTRPGFNAMTLAHTGPATDIIFGITQTAVTHFPQGDGFPRFGRGLTKEITCPELSTHFWTGTAGALNTGRGGTLKRFHGSEFAMWEKPNDLLGAVGPSLVPHRSSIVLETTASGFDSDAHNFWREAQGGANGYATLFIPWWLCDQENYRLPLWAADELGTLEPEEQDLVDRHGLSPEEIKWRRAKIREYGRTRFMTEYAEDEETCWAAVGGMFYDAELLKVLMHKAPSPTETDWAGALEVYGPHFGERVVIGCDTAEGVGGDRSAWTARTFPDRRLLAVFQDRAIEPRGLAGMLNTWGRRFAAQGRPALLVPEKNAHGITVIRHLRDDYQYPLSSIYQRQTHDTSVKEANDKLGFYTSAESKPFLLDCGRTLLNAARDGQASVPSIHAIRDAFAIRRDPKTGKVDTNGRDVWISECLCEVGQQGYPPPPFIGRKVVG